MFLWRIEVNSFDGHIYESDFYDIEEIKEIADKRNVDVREVFHNAINYFEVYECGAKHYGEFNWWLHAHADDDERKRLLTTNYTNGHETTIF
ncbi:hypothetical protein OAM41_02940 [Gammaproteobacteria bacterium]|nr:hypothetical protein [Gammaproteobacteria bacterium]